MGLFSGSFGTGLVTGLATSVDKSLRNAMDKRDEEMSAARRFWQTRQAQKLDMKEDHDRRATKALDRLIREADGDVALGLAAYQAAGNDPDSVEKYLAKIDAVRDAKGTFKLSDNLILPEGYKAGGIKVDRDAAEQSILMQMKGVDASRIAIEDPLSNIGLGLKGGASQSVADKVNALIPPSEVTEVEGLSGVRLDMSKMLAAEKYAQDQQKFEKAMAPSNYDEAMFATNERLAAIKREDYETDDAFQAARNVELENRQRILKDIAAVASAEEAAGNTGVSDSIMRVVWTDTREQGRKLAGIGGKDESRYYTNAAGQMVMAIQDPQGYAGAVMAADRASAKRFVTAQRRDDGSFYSSATNIIGTDQYLKAAYAELTGENAAEETGVKDQPPEMKFSSPDSIAADMQGFAAHIFDKMPDINDKRKVGTGPYKNKTQHQILFAKLIDAGASREEANKIISDAYTAESNKRQAADEKYSGFVMPGSGLSADATAMEVTTDEDGGKTAGNVSWNPSNAPSMVYVLRDKDVPAGTKEIVLSDYVNLMKSLPGKQNFTLEDARERFGVK